MGFGKTPQNRWSTYRTVSVPLALGLVLLVGSCATPVIENTVSTNGELPPPGEVLTPQEIEKLRQGDLRLVAAELDGGLLPQKWSRI